MWKILGFLLVLGGVAGVLYSWVSEQKKRQRILEEFILFLEKSISSMEKDNLKIVTHFEKYVSQQNNHTNVDAQLFTKILSEIATRLSSNTYPKGQSVWEEVIKEEGQNLALDKETFAIILQAGNGFFGRSREENIRFLQKSIRELEIQQKKCREKDAQERKVWVPVTMLGTVMLLIVFV